MEVDRCEFSKSTWVDGKPTRADIDGSWLQAGLRLDSETAIADKRKKMCSAEQSEKKASMTTQVAIGYANLIRAANRRDDDFLENAVTELRRIAVLTPEQRRTVKMISYFKELAKSEERGAPAPGSQ